jgi:hypothetical protein
MTRRESVRVIKKLIQQVRPHLRRSLRRTALEMYPFLKGNGDWLGLKKS